VLAARWKLTHDWRTQFLTQVILGAGIGSGLVWLALSSSKMAEASRAVLLWRPLRQLGKISYSLYLTHAAPVCARVILLSYLAYRLSPTSYFFLTLTLGALSSLVLAFLFYISFERPFVRPRGTVHRATLQNSGDAGATFAS
jgi:peptidoglycan/LPS O-acetylase OafA/YrhL